MKIKNKFLALLLLLMLGTASCATLTAPFSSETGMRSAAEEEEEEGRGKIRWNEYED